MNVMVTGAAGFIGSNLVLHLRQRWPNRKIVSYDLLTYAGNLENLAPLRDDDKHVFVKGDVADPASVRHTIAEHDITGIFHLAAESHVDRSIVDPLAFVRTNVEGTANLLSEAKKAWAGRDGARFVHVSTDEVFGSLGPKDPAFCEATPYDPRSPYSASKAASDHLARAWHNTYGFPVVITNCSNNYGPRQFPEKLIPVVIHRALEGEPVPVYGRGDNVRDWLYVQDHCEALALVFERGAVGETYCIGGDSEMSNIRLVEALLDVVDAAQGVEVGQSRSLIRFVDDRPGHDFRYAMNSQRIRRDLGWQPSVDLSTGLSQTVKWYLHNRDWCARARSGAHREFEEQWYGARLGEATETANEE